MFIAFPKCSIKGFWRKTSWQGQASHWLCPVQASNTDLINTFFFTSSNHIKKHLWVVCWYFLVPNTLVVELIMHFSALLEDNCLENIWSLSVNASDVFSGCLAACLNLQKLLTQNVHNLCDLSLARGNKIKKTVENWKSQFRGQMGWNEWNIIVKLTLWC